jgi:hypothetical protein
LWQTPYRLLLNVSEHPQSCAALVSVQADNDHVAITPSAWSRTLS